MDRPGEFILPLIGKLEVIKESDPTSLNDEVKTVALKILDTNEYECVDGHCSKCKSKEKRVYKVKAPGQKPPFKFICPEGHDVCHNFIND